MKTLRALCADPDTSLDTLVITEVEHRRITDSYQQQIAALQRLLDAQATAVDAAATANTDVAERADTPVSHRTFRAYKCAMDGWCTQYERRLELLERALGVEKRA